MKFRDFLKALRDAIFSAPGDKPKDPVTPPPPPPPPPVWPRFKFGSHIYESPRKWKISSITASHPHGLIVTRYHDETRKDSAIDLIPFAGGPARVLATFKRETIQRPTLWAADWIFPTEKGNHRLIHINTTTLAVREGQASAEEICLAATNFARPRIASSPWPQGKAILQEATTGAREPLPSIDGVITQFCGLWAIVQSDNSGQFNGVVAWPSTAAQRAIPMPAKAGCYSDGVLHIGDHEGNLYELRDNRPHIIAALGKGRIYDICPHALDATLRFVALSNPCRIELVRITDGAHIELLRTVESKLGWFGPQVLHTPEALYFTDWSGSTARLYIGKPLE